MIKNQKGVTLIALAVTVLILLILGTVIIRESINLVNSSRTRKYITIMSLIRVEVEKLFEEFEFENDSSDLQNADVSKLMSTGGEKIDLTPGEMMPSQSDISNEEQMLIIENVASARDTNSDGIADVDVDNLWYKWSLTVVSNLNIDYSNLVTSEDYFIVNYATGDVLFSRPIKMENGEYAYSLVGLKELDNYEEN